MYAKLGKGSIVGTGLLPLTGMHSLTFFMIAAFTLIMLGYSILKLIPRLRDVNTESL